MEFERGKTTQKLEVIGKSKKTGTLITFKPDPTIFTLTVEFKFDILANRLRELAFLNPGIEIVLKDERDEKTETFFTGTASSSSFASWVRASSRCIPNPSRSRANGPAN